MSTPLTSGRRVLPGKCWRKIKNSKLGVGNFFWWQTVVSTPTAKILRDLLPQDAF